MGALPTDELYLDYIKDLAKILLERANQAASFSGDDGDSDFNSGRVMAYGEVVDLIKNQALSFGIDPDSLGLSRFDISAYLTGKGTEGTNSE